MLFKDKVPNPEGGRKERRGERIGQKKDGPDCHSGERSSINEKGVGEIFWEGMEGTCISVVVFISSCHCYCLTALVKDFTRCKIYPI